jgi:hypothetical protein
METTNEVPPPYDWLVTLYLGGDNDLFNFADTLLAEAQRVGSSSRVAVVAEHDPVRPGLPTKRGQIFRGRWDCRDIGLTNGDAESIIDFIGDSKEKFPAARRMLVLWDHGNGWQNVHTFEALADAADQLRFLNLQAIFRQQPGTDIVCFDSCLMAMIEIAYELRDKVKYIIASENVVPADSGWPYEAILRGLTNEPDRDFEQIVSTIVHGFSGSYNGSDEPITLSALRLSEAEPTVKAIDALACALIDGCSDGSRQKVLFARRYCQSFGNADYIDLVSFCEELERLLPGTEIATEAEKVRTAVGQLVVTCTRGATPSIRGAHGVSIYYPDRPMSPLYHKLAFAKTKDCRWAAFLHMVTPDLPAPHDLESPHELTTQPAATIKPADTPTANPATPDPIVIPLLPPQLPGTNGNGSSDHPDHP